MRSPKALLYVVFFCLAGCSNLEPNIAALFTDEDHESYKTGQALYKSNTQQENATKDNSVVESRDENSSKHPENARPIKRGPIPNSMDLVVAALSESGKISDLAFISSPSSAKVSASDLANRQTFDLAVSESAIQKHFEQNSAANQTLIEQQVDYADQSDSEAQNNQTQQKIDYSDYDFITPTDSANGNLSKGSSDLKAENLDPSKQDADLLDRIRNDFKLDLSYSNKRIESQLNWYVKNPSYLDRTFNRSARYLHHIVEEIEKRDLPMELALLPLVESAFDPFAYSHGRASGLWQFIPGTGKMYGMHQNWWYDGRRDVLASTQGALDYLTHLNKLFNGNWLHALASYNSGSGRVSGAIKKNKKQNKATDFWHLKLPRETRAYVPKLLAISKLVANPQKYNLSLPAIKNEPYFKKVDIGSQIDLAQAAKMAEIDIKELYKLNPAFNRWATAPMGPHRLLVPIEKAKIFEDALSKLDAKQRLTWNRYSVLPGDSLIKIANKFNTTPTLIKQINNLKGNMIRVKQKLLIPIASQGNNYYDLSETNRLEAKQKRISQPAGASKHTHTVKAGDTMWDLARAHKVGVRSLAKWNGMAPTDVLRPGKKLLIWSNAQSTAQIASTEAPQLDNRQMIKRIGYRVRKGDSLARIANKFNVSIRDLVSWNKLNKKKYLQPGQKLTIYVDITRG